MPSSTRSVSKALSRSDDTVLMEDSYSLSRDDEQVRPPGPQEG